MCVWGGGGVLGGGAAGSQKGSGGVSEELLLWGEEGRKDVGVRQWSEWGQQHGAGPFGKGG